MNLTKWSWWLVLLSLCISQIPANAATAPPERLSILQIALDCEKFESREVTVLGSIELGFESRSICPTLDFHQGDTLNCLWLKLDDHLDEEDLDAVRARLGEDSYVIVDATVACSAKGHLSLYGAGLAQITLIIENRSGRLLWEFSGEREENEK